jgi:hypothetical protein
MTPSLIEHLLKNPVSLALKVQEGGFRQQEIG